jgi:hypothetical protein
MIQKSVVYVTDQNNGSYQSGQVMLDTSSLSNSGKWASYSEAVLAVPLVMALAPTAAITGWDSGIGIYAAGLKNAFTSLIYSMSVEYNNSTVLQLTPFTGIYLHYKALTSMSLDDQEKLSAVTNFYKDTGDSWFFSATPTAEGCGESNNRNMGWEMLFPGLNNITDAGGVITSAPVSSGASFLATVSEVIGGSSNAIYTPSGRPLGDWTGYNRTTANYGFYRRQKTFATDFKATGRYAEFLSQTNAQQMAFNQYSISTGGATDTNIHYWSMLATIRLKDLSDFFNQLPLVRGAYLRFIINFNMGAVTLKGTEVAGTAITPAVVKWEQTAANLTQAVFPCMFASADVGQGSYPLAPTTSFSSAKDVVLAIGISSLNPSTYGGAYSKELKNSSFPQCRLYVPVYTLNPIAEAAYLEANPSKTIIYRDILNYNVNSTGADASTVSQLLTNGVVNPKQVLIFSYLTATANPTATTVAHNTSPLASAFTSSPCTTSPLPVFTNVNLLVAGINIFSMNQTYNWQHYVDEIQHENAINGGQTTGLQSGLLDYWSWTNMFRVLSINVSRRIGSENSIPKSVQLTMQKLSEKDLQLICFIEIERSLTISLLNGQLVA